MFDTTQTVVDSQRQLGLSPGYILADVVEERGGSAVLAAGIRAGKFQLECTACAIATRRGYHSCMQCYGARWHTHVIWRRYRRPRRETIIGASCHGAGSGYGLVRDWEACDCAGTGGGSRPVSYAMEATTFNARSGAGSGDGEGDGSGNGSVLVVYT